MPPNVDIIVDCRTLSVEERRAFLLGVVECESNVTTHFGGDLIETYDQGRATGRDILGLED